MLKPSLINRPLNRILIGKICKGPANGIEVLTKTSTNSHRYIEYFHSTDFVFGLNFDKDNFVVTEKYNKLFYQKGELNPPALNHVKGLVRYNIDTLKTNILTITIENNEELSIELQEEKNELCTYVIRPQHKSYLVEKFKGKNWTSYDIIVAIKQDKIYILILNQ